MKKISLLLIFIFSFVGGFSQVLSDDGISSTYHKKYMGKGIFSKTEILFKKENLNTLTSSFTWGDPIYSRMYWAHGINSVYKSNGWKVPTDTYRYKVFFYANGDLISSEIMQTKGERTSTPMCLYRASNDSYDWGKEMHVLKNNLGKLKAGNNSIKIEICAFTHEGEKTSQAISTASFNLYISATELKKAGNITFSKIKTKWSSSSDAWKEWTITTSKGEGSLKSTWGKTDEWDYSVGNISGKIKTKWSNDYTEWTLTGGDKTVTMKQQWSNNWKEWNISEGSKTLTLKTTWSSSAKAWQEWDVSGNGTMNIKTSWSSSDKAWQEWNITDDMKSVSPELKMAAIFIVIYQAIK